MQATQAQARENLITPKERSKYYYDQKVNDRIFREGDQVYLLKDARQNNMDEHYSSPFPLIKLLGDRNAEIRCNANRTKIVHLNKLKKAFI
ncbi:hypothetical protein TKK_0008158 [Trichogramma kaykai]|uniref:Uncharacterized protein n=1 Tax=Trichogramma kaykai TaxID=54128 RepID=A0ABD2X7G7_9HYME